MTTATKSKSRTGSLLASFPLKEFKAAFLAVARAAPSRTARPVLLCVRLDLTPGEAVLTSTNLEQWIVHRMACDYAGEPTSLLLTRSTVQDILRVAGGETVELYAGPGDKLTVKAGTSSWALTTDDPDIFPAGPALELASFHEVEACRLALAIKRTIKETRPGEEKGVSKSGVQFEPMLTALGLTTANGGSLAHQQVEAACVQPFTLISPLPLVPDTAVRTLQSLLSDGDTMVKVGFPSRDWGYFEVGGTTLMCRLAEGAAKFPAWRKYVAQFPEPAGTLTADCGAIRLAVARACISLDDDSHALVVEFGEQESPDTPSLIRLTSESSRGQSEVTEPIGWDGTEAIEVLIDPQYLKGMLGSLGDDTPITLDVFTVDSRVPLKLTTECGFLGLSQLMGKKGS